jgi:hypothetical protein
LSYDFLTLRNAAILVWHADPDVRDLGHLVACFGHTLRCYPKRAVAVFVSHPRCRPATPEFERTAMAVLPYVLRDYAAVAVVVEGEGPEHTQKLWAVRALARQASAPGRVYVRASVAKFEATPPPQLRDPCAVAAAIRATLRARDPRRVGSGPKRVP